MGYFNSGGYEEVLSRSPPKPVGELMSDNQRVYRPVRDMKTFLKEGVPLNDERQPARL